MTTPEGERPDDSRLRGALKRRLPARLWRPASDLYWWWRNRGRHQMAGLVSARRRRSVHALRALAGRHHGQRCFILGNGPSLRNTDLSLLRHEFTFGMNRIYLAFAEIGFPTSYYLAVNDLVLEQCAGEIAALRVPRFLAWRARKWFPSDDDTIYLDTDFTGRPTFSPDVRGRVFEGSTVTYVALQLAYHMGFEEVILIGVDHRFESRGRPNETVVAQGPDSDHFDARYFGPGFRWQLPDLEASEAAYRLARQAYEASGRRVLDATIGGRLQVFPTVDYSSLFPGSAPRLGA